MKYRHQINASVDEETITTLALIARYHGVKPAALASAILQRLKGIPVEKLNTVLHAIDESVAKVTQRKTDTRRQKK